MNDNKLAASTYGVRERELSDMKDNYQEAADKLAKRQSHTKRSFREPCDVPVVVPGAEMVLERIDPVTEDGVYVGINGNRAVINSRCKPKPQKNYHLRYVSRTSNELLNKV